GLGYILSLLQRSELAEIDLQEDLKELDASMAAAALKQITEEDRNDYLHGAMGVVHYFTTRSKEPIIRQYLETLVTAFCNKAVVSGKGLWFRNFIIDKKEKERIDTGLSHGNAGFLLILLNVWEAGVLKERLTDVISKGMEFLISQQMKTNPEEEQHAFFPFSVNATDHNDIYFSQRLAWCYGDLNIILLLYRVGSSFKINRWTDLADTLSGQTVKRMDATATLALDSHFCHGTAGLAQFYRTLHNVTKNGLFDTAADYWIGRTIQLLEKEWKENTYNGKECDLINGLPGINLVLLSYLCKKDLAWSRSLLL
ncbi:MAG: lanthionine synthetase LanC family protein, partial [Chitinophagaceae bacterium]